jgi:hypothetical protein
MVGTERREAERNSRKVSKVGTETRGKGREKCSKRARAMVSRG